MTKKNKQKNSNKDIRISSSEKQELELKREWDDFRRDEILRQFRKTG